MSHQACCAICGRAARGFIWIDPPTRHGYDPNYSLSNHKKSYRRLCSDVCQLMYQELYKRNKTMDREPLEQQAIEAVLSPLGDYVSIVGADKALNDYSRAEILGMINKILDVYHVTLQALYKDEIPF